MIAADTSAWIDYSKGLESRPARQLEQALVDCVLVMPLPVIFEILSGPGVTREAEHAIQRLPVLELLPDFWQRAGTMRRHLLRQGKKARAMDCLIAQNCLDHEVPLIAVDNDYRHFKALGLELIS